VEKPTEDTYVAEFVSVTKQLGALLGFDAEFNRKTPSGKPDIIIYYKNKPVAVIEVKEPRIPLSDPSLNEQALRYADWYRKNRDVLFYGIHNMKYLNLFKFVQKEQREKTLLDFVEGKKTLWVPVSNFPFKIIPWAKSIDDYKQISTNNRAQENLQDFLLKFKEILEGKTLDLSSDVIEAIRRYIEEGANRGLTKFEDMYRRNEENVRELFEAWRSERGLDKPKNDSQLREFLGLMIKEQLYTFSMKVLFYLVLQSIDAEMATKLKENLASVEPSDPLIFKRIFDMLFAYAIDKTGDFEEVFGTNTVDKLPLVDATLQPLKELISYLNQIRWSEINVDVIGRIFEGLIYTERRHLLGQHFTDTAVVDLILAATLKSPGRLIDPACGSGTFLVRALNYWRAKYGYRKENYQLIEGIDIDKLASMLSKINLYIQAIKEIEDKIKYYPKIRHSDFFKEMLPPEFSYITTNPPYTRQEEMAMAFYDKAYKKWLDESVKDIPDWSKRASIYAYFLVKGAKLLKEGGRLGFIVENSWLNAEYGSPLKNWFLDNFTVEYVIESLVERWFEDAAVITNIIIAEKRKNPYSVTQFLFLRKKLAEIFGAAPPASDLVANQRYYERIEDVVSRGAGIKLDNDYIILEDEDVRKVMIKKHTLKTIESKLGRWGILKGPKKYLELVLNFIEGKDTRLRLLSDFITIERGLTTNANEIFYLPSRHWKSLEESENYLTLKGPSHKIVKLNKHYLKPLIRTAHIENSSYCVSTLKRQGVEDFVLWVGDTSQVKDPGVISYVEWVKNFIISEHEMDNTAFPTLVKQLDSTTWTKLPDKSGAMFLFKNDIHKNFAIYMNKIEGSQVDKRLFLGYLKENIDPRIVFAVLNSVFTYLGMELIGRSNLGEGALDVNVVDYNKIPTVNPKMVEETLKTNGKYGDFLKLIDQMLVMRPSNIDLEFENNIRLKMEEHMLSLLDYDRDDIKHLYKELVMLVNLRTQRAISVKRAEK